MIQTSGHFYCNHKTASHHSPLKPTPAKKQLLTLPHHRLPMALAPPASTTTTSINNHIQSYYLNIVTTNHSTAFHPHHFNFSQHLLLLKLPRTSAHHLPPLPQNRCHKSSCSSFSPIFSMHSMLHHNSSSHLIQHKASSSRSPRPRNRSSYLDRIGRQFSH